MMEVEAYSSSNGAETNHPRFGMTLQSPKISPRDGGVCPVSVNGRDVAVAKATVAGSAKVKMEISSAKLPLDTSSTMFSMDTDDDSQDSDEDVAGSAPPSIRSSPNLTCDRKLLESDLDNEVSSDQKSVDETESKVESSSSFTVFDDPLSEKEEEDPIECGECDTEFSTMTLYMDHNCSKTGSKPDMSDHLKSARANGTESELSDVESFEGKIVYNPDGSAYIIEGDDSEFSESESLIDIKEGSIVDKSGSSEPPNLPYPQIANAFFVPKNPTSFFNNFYVMPSQQNIPEAPIMHSYRVYDVRKGSRKSEREDNNNTEPQKSAQENMDDQSQSSTSPVDATTVPTKPILMCFMCKLSFGFAKSFVSHAVGEHAMTLNDKEKGLMSRKNASAIIQGVGKDKEPLISFLEPNPNATQVSSCTSASSATENIFCHSSCVSPFTAKASTKVSYVYSKPTVSNCLGSMPSSAHPFDLSSHRKNKETNYKSKSSLSPPKTLPLDSSGKSVDNLTKASSPKSPKISRMSPAEKSAAQSDVLAEHDSHGSRHAKNDMFAKESHSNSATPLFSSHNGLAHCAVPSSMEETMMSSTGPFMTGFLGACDEHPQGRSHSVECPKCDMVLSSSRSLGGHMTVMHSRNSCKTLKCPKCNWHYKYQETLEIHMKEKHPESDTQCVYCITGQPHPRLARGETYTCGYKPYRCDVCNYSTTTKGNLSIHMQSDKHLNNMQELANGGELNKMAAPQSYEDTSMQKKQQKPKPTWRCDVCNYETNVARNLRIHMTSEKHTHNMMVLQQNMKHLQMNPLGLFGQQEPTLIGFPQIAPAGFPYDQFDQPMFLAAMHGSMNFPMNLANKEHESMMPPETNGGHLGDQTELFQCCVCNVYSVDAVEALHQHMQMDRTKQREHDNISIAGGTYMCNLCSYKTNLKANFQLHCKTDKHLQRLQLVNHIREGGPSNEWRLKYLNVSNPVQVHCNACDYYTNSIHKLQIHTTNHRHESNAHMFRHLQICETRVKSSNKYYHCALCNYACKTKLGLIQHIRSMKHMRQENLHQLQVKHQGNAETLQMAQVYQVKEYKEGEHINFDDTDGDREEEATAQDGEIVDKQSTMPSLLHSPSDLTPQPDATLSASTAPPTSSPSLSSAGNSATPRGSSTHTSPSSRTGSATVRDSNGNIANNNTIESATGATGTPVASTSSGASMTDTATTSSSNNNNVLGTSEQEDQPQVCPYCNFSSVNEMRLKAHVLTQHGQVPREIHCPLCQDEFKEKAKLEKHLVQVHNVTPEGLQRLLVMVDQSDWMVPAKPQATMPPHFPANENDEINVEAIEEAAKLAAEEAIDTAAAQEKPDEDQYRCQTCAKTFCNIDALYAHQNELGHLELKQTPRGPGYLCWKKGCNQYFKTAQSLQVHFREIHAKRQQLSVADRNVYTFRCNQCTLAFKSADKLQIHTQYHLIQSVTQCKLCNRSFRSIAALRKHIETSHVDVNDNEKDKIHGSLAANALALLNAAGSEIFTNTKNSESCSEENKENPEVSSVPGETHNELAMDVDFTTEDSSNQAPDKMEAPTPEEDKTKSGEKWSFQEYKEEQFMEDYMNSQSIAEGSYDDSSRKYKCHRCKVAFTKQSYLTGHNKTLQHRKGDKLSYPMEKYLDPNRPYKCDVCKESFTQKNILLVHYNSVSHLHKLKQVAQHGGQPTASSTPSPAPSPAQTLMVSAQSSSQSQAQNSADSGDKKPFRCNICKVAYSQGSTLDIHVRSVLHKTRASRLQELVMAGQIDPTQPLIEQPDTQKSQQQQQKKLLTEMLQPKQLELVGGNPLATGQLLFPGFSTSFPNMPGISSPSLVSASQALQTQFSPALTAQASLVSSSHGSRPSLPANLPLDVQNGKIEGESTSLTQSSKSVTSQATISNPSTDQSKVKSSEQNESEQNRSTPTPQPKNPFALESFAPNSLAAAIHDAVSKQQLQQQQQQLQMHLDSVSQMSTAAAISSVSQMSNTFRSRSCFARFKPQVHKNLLENIGFECVMQFNEFNQTSPPKREREDKDEESEEEHEEVNGETRIETDEKTKDEETVDVKDNLPEINRSICSTCHKEFSSVWVLKAHEEEFHRVIVPIEAVEDFGEKFKTDYEKKQPKEPEQILPAQGAASGNSASTPTPATGSPVSMESLTSDTMQQNPLDMAPLSMPMFNMMPMPMTLNMPMAMNMHPPLIPMMMQHNMDGSFTPPLSMMDPNVLAQQKQMQLQQQQQQQQQVSQNSKRARTRISDEQLKILRAHFDINNSPSEEQIIAMSDQSGLPQKVIKHWFRNTLFKERQRNKDSPYNFNNPPSTQLNLEEYEKTGKVNTENKDDADDDRGSVASTPTLPPPTIKEQSKETKASLELPVNLGLVKSEQIEPRLPMPPVTSSPPTLGIPMPSLTSPASSETSDFADIKMSPSSGCKRAIRTRFTDYQIKILQEHFEQNAYPKDDDLDHLSKMLNLSPRVIVVWFQNARQKARKSYENQPVMDLSGEDGTQKGALPSRDSVTSFVCKKCSAVFQKHYELIRHQKNKCMPEEDLRSNNLSRTGASMSGDDDSHSDMSPDDLSQNASSDALYKSYDTDKDESRDGLSVGNFKCEKCKLTFKHFEQWNEHQNVHMMNPTLFPPFPPGESAFAMLQSVAQQHENKTPAKRKMEEYLEDLNEQPRDKRLRTTILPEQLDYLYQKYQLDCSPSRKQLENISREVGLKKRVVQVWFQNTRARERKGQYRAHQQLINKRCPFCRALFRAKSALESHLATKHPEQMAKGELNVDNIPDASTDSLPSTPQPPMTPSSSASTPQNFDLSKLMVSQMGMQPFLPFMSPGGMSLFPPAADPLQMSMKKMYEDSLKKYIDELSAASHVQQRSMVPESLPKRSSATESRTSDSKKKSSPTADDDDAPLDLSKPMKVSVDCEKMSEGPPTDASERSFDDFHGHRRRSLDDSYSETHSENEMDMHSLTGSNPTSPNSHHGRHSSGGKRYRTQMTNLQVRVMKTLFTDYKTPTMAECEMLGREISLPKRVVQVWFQNARAKEKKSKLAYQKTFGTEVDFTRPPEDCSLCNFKYSHKYTVQDHIFTRKHIENVKKFLQTQAEAEREMTDPRGMSQMYQQQQQQQSRDGDKVCRKLWDDSSSQIAQLQAMGYNSSSVDNKKPVVKKEVTSTVSTKKEDIGTSKRKSSSTATSSATSAVAAAAAAASSTADASLPLQMMSPFANFLPSMDPSMLSYMYPGMPGFYPGLGMPLMQPGFFPGAEHLFAAYDPTTYGTPLPLLQIPQQTIKSVAAKLTDPNSSLAQYTQDCKSFADLKTAVTSADYKLAQEATVDVGYICKKCQMVYPGKEACDTHQRSVCFVGKTPDSVKIRLKLEQIQYECKACHEKTSTIHEFKVHCQMEAHKTKASKYRQQHSSSASSQHHRKTTSASPSLTLPFSSSPLGRHSLSSEHPEAMAAAEKIRADLQARLLANMSPKSTVNCKRDSKSTSLLNSETDATEPPKRGSEQEEVSSETCNNNGPAEDLSVKSE